MNKSSHAPDAFDRDWAYFVWVLFASAVVMMGFLKFAE